MDDQETEFKTTPLGRIIEKTWMECDLESVLAKMKERLMMAFTKEKEIDFIKTLEFLQIFFRYLLCIFINSFSNAFGISVLAVL